MYLFVSNFSKAFLSFKTLPQNIRNFAFSHTCVTCSKENPALFNSRLTSNQYTPTKLNDTKSNQPDRGKEGIQGIFFFFTAAQQTFSLNTLTGRNLSMSRHAIDAVCTEWTGRQCKHIYTIRIWVDVEQQPPLHRLTG